MGFILKTLLLVFLVAICTELKGANGGPVSKRRDCQQFTDVNCRVRTCPSGTEVKWYSNCNPECRPGENKGKKCNPPVGQQDDDEPDTSDEKRASVHPKKRTE